MNYGKAKQYFEKYLDENFDLTDKKINHKINHTYRVVENARYLCNGLNLNKENTELALIIALLHDIGRFEQAKEIKSFREDINNYDHASLGVKLLFEKNEIKKYISDTKYYSIIEKAIANHSKYILDESEMTKEEILHCKIIRDADKLDSFKSKIVDDIYTMANITPDDIEDSKVTSKVYESFKLHKTILSKDRETGLDIWISYIALIYGLEFKQSYELVKQKDYINKLFNRFEYKLDNKRMEELKNIVLDYLDSRLNGNK